MNDAASHERVQAASLPEASEQAYRSLGHRHERLLKRVLDLGDYQRLARPRLPRAVYGYVANGVEADVAREDNRKSFQDWRMVTRVLRDVSRRSQATELFGHRYGAPFGIAPMGAAAVVAYDADNRMARAAAAANIPFVLSANSITPIEELVRNNPNAWFASYQSPEPDKVQAMVERVARAGIKVYVVTVDVPVSSNREDDKRAGYSMPLRPTPGLTWDGLTHPRWLIGDAGRTVLRRGIPVISNLEATGGVSLLSREVATIAGHSDFTWKSAELIRKFWKGPLVIKGLLSGEDARIARESGVDGIVVSNHGGRQLDGAVSPLDVLPEIKAQSGDMAVLIDSGFRRGTDVLKALALGADFILIGRPFLFASVVAGEAGVQHAISLLSKEIDIDQALLGLADIADAGPDMLRKG
jgi:L-lactate dehydrogenase (cytochrome)